MVVRELAFNFLKRNWRLSFIVTVSMALITLLLVTIFPGMPFEDALAVADSWPQIMKELFGDPIFSFTDIYGWLYLQIFHITYWVAFGVLASILAANIVAKEIEENTIDILLSYPITRGGLIISRMITLSVIMLIASVVMLLVCTIGISIAGFPINLEQIIQVFLMGFVISMVFASLSLLVSLWTFQQVLSVFFTLGIMGFFFLYEEALAKLYPCLDRISFLNPFHYYKPESILIHHSPSMLNFIYLLLFFMVFSFLSIVLFKRKDIS